MRRGNAENIVINTEKIKDITNGRRKIGMTCMRHIERIEHFGKERRTSGGNEK